MSAGFGLGGLAPDELRDVETQLRFRAAVARRSMDELVEKWREAEGRLREAELQLQIVREAIKAQGGTPQGAAPDREA